MIINRFGRRALPLCLAALFCLLADVSYAQLATNRNILYVKPSPQGTGDGSSWDNAAGTADLQEALDVQGQSALYYGDVVYIYMAAGSYLLNSTLRYFAITDPLGYLHIKGGFPADAAGTSEAGRNVLANATILDGGGTVDRLIRPYLNPDESSNSMTRSLFLEGLYFQGATSYAVSKVSYISHCVIRNNVNGIIYTNAFSCLFIGNTGVAVEGDAGGIYNCTIVKNNTGIHAVGGTIVANCVLWGNTVQYTGDPWLRYCAIQDYVYGSVISPYGHEVNFGLDASNDASTSRTHLSPLFNDPDGGDYTLNHKSPLINVGDVDDYLLMWAYNPAIIRNMQVPRVDLNFTPRIAGVGWEGNFRPDIGAFEATDYEFGGVAIDYVNEKLIPEPWWDIYPLKVGLRFGDKSLAGISYYVSTPNMDRGSAYDMGIQTMATNWIANNGEASKTLYVSIGGVNYRPLIAGVYERSKMQAVTVPARQATPAYTIDYVNETTKQNFSTLDIASLTNNDAALADAVAGSGTPLDISSAIADPVSTSKSIYFRREAVATTFSPAGSTKVLAEGKFKSAVQTLPVPRRPRIRMQGSFTGTPTFTRPFHPGPSPANNITFTEGDGPGDELGVSVTGSNYDFIYEIYGTDNGVVSISPDKRTITILKGGTQQVVVKLNATADAHFKNHEGRVATLEITKINQTINWGSGDLVYSYCDEVVSFYKTGPSSLKTGDPSASSGLPLTFTSSDPATVEIINGNQARVHKTGEVTITVSQGGDDSYWPAASITRKLRVEKCNVRVDVNAGSKVFDGTPDVTADINSLGTPVFTGLIPAPADMTVYNVVKQRSSVNVVDVRLKQELRSASVPAYTVPTPLINGNAVRGANVTTAGASKSNQETVITDNGTAINSIVQNPAYYNVSVGEDYYQITPRIITVKPGQMQYYFGELTASFNVDFYDLTIGQNTNVIDMAAQKSIILVSGDTLTGRPQHNLVSQPAAFPAAGGIPHVRLRGATRYNASLNVFRPNNPDNPSDTRYDGYLNGLYFGLNPAISDAALAANVSINNASGVYNYGTNFQGDKVLRILPLPVEVRLDENVPKEKFYGDPDPAFTADYKVPDALGRGIAYLDAPSGTLGYAKSGSIAVQAANAAAGTYKIVRNNFWIGAVPTDACIDGNSGIVMVNGVPCDCSDPAEASSIPVYLPSYKLTVNGENFVIKKRPIGVSTAGYTKVYGEADPAFAANFSNKPAIPLTTEAMPVLAFSRVSGENVGYYDISETSSPTSVNYTFDYDLGRLQITPRALSVELAPKVVTYDGQPHSLSFNKATGLQFSDGVNAAEVTVTASYTEPNVTPYNMAATGAVVRNAGADVTGNYTLNFPTATLEIRKRTASVILIPANKTKFYGEADPDFVTGASIDNLAPGHSAYVYRADTGNDVGVYPLTVRVRDADDNDVTANYDFTANTATLEILPRPLTINLSPETVTYDGQPHSLSFNNAAGLQYSDAVSAADVAVTASYKAASLMPYSIAATGAVVRNSSSADVSSNYSITYAANTLLINQIALTVTPDAGQGKKYDRNTANQPTITYTITGSLVSGDAPDGALSRTAGEEVGAYDINQGTLVFGSDANGWDNYDITIAPEVFTITKRQLVFNINAATKVYGDDDPDLNSTLNYTVGGDGFIGSDKLDLLNITRNQRGSRAGENVGSYSIVVYHSTSPFYEVDRTVPDNFTITQRPVTVTPVAGQFKLYGEADPTAFTYTLSQTLVTGYLPTSGVAINDAASGGLARQLGENTGTYSYLINSLQFAEGANGNNYNVTLAPETFEIRKANQTIGFKASLSDEQTYCTESIELSRHMNSDAASGLSAFSFKSSDPGVIGISGTTAIINGVGTATITASEAGNGNYNPAATTIIITVNPCPVTVTIANKSKQYNSTALPDPALTYTLDKELRAGNTATGALERDAGETVGLYPIRVGTLGFGANYTVSNPLATGTLEITRQSQTITSIGDITKTYGDAAFTVAGAASSGLAVSFSVSDPAVVSVSGNTFTPLKVGTVAATASQAGDINRLPAPDLTFRITVIKKPIKIIANDKTITYGEQNPIFTHEAQHPVPGDKHSGELYCNTAFTRALTPAGVYPITQGTLTYGGNYAETFEEGVFRVLKADQTISFADITKTYGDAVFTVTATSSKGLTDFTYTIADPSVASVSGSTVTVHKAGTTTITAFSPGDNNINPESKTVNLVVQPRPITVTFDNQTKAYGQQDVTPYSFNITSAGQLVGSDTHIGAAARTSGENVGIYTISRGTMDFGANYDVSWIDGKLTIYRGTPAVSMTDIVKTYGDAAFTLSVATNSDGVPVYTIADSEVAAAAGSTATVKGVGTTTVGVNIPQTGNWEAISTMVNLTVNPCPLTISISEKSKVYAEPSNPDPALSFTHTPMAYGEPAPSVGLSRVAGEDAGMYLISGILLAALPNYDITWQTNYLTILKADQTITFTPPANMVYGDAPQALSATASSGLAVSFSADNVQAGKIEGSSLFVINAGAITATVSQAGNDNYNPAPSVSYPVVISPKPITVEAKNVKKYYGENDPPLEVRLAGGSAMAYSDDLRHVVSAVTRQAGENIGIYDIYIGLSGIKAANYAVNFNSDNDAFEILLGELEVKADDVSKIYRQDDPKLTYTIIRGVLAPGETLTGSLERDSGETVGEYPIHMGSLAPSLPENYNYSFQPGIFTIRKAKAHIEIPVTEYPYTGNPVNLIYTVDPSEAGSSVTFDGKTTAPTEIGDYEACVTVTDTHNYEENTYCAIVSIRRNPRYDGGKIKVVTMVQPKGENNTNFTILDIQHIKVLSLVIVDRAGNKILDVKEYQNDFDMSNLHAGTYFYFVRYTMSGIELEQDGYVELIKE